MYLSNHDKRVMNMLIEARDKATGFDADVLTKHIVNIRNTIEYAAIEGCEAVEDTVEQETKDSNTPVVLKRGESITLRMC